MKCISLGDDIKEKCNCNVKLVLKKRPGFTESSLKLKLNESSQLLSGHCSV